MNKNSNAISLLSKLILNNVIIALAMIIVIRIDFFVFQYFKNASLFFMAPSVAIMMLNHYKKPAHLYGVFFGAVIANLLNQFTLPICMGLGLSIVTEAYIGHKIYEYFVLNHKPSLDIYFRLILISTIAILAPLINVFIFSISVDQFKNIYSSAFSSLFVTNYLREILGIFFTFSIINKFLEKKMRWWYLAIIPITFFISKYLTEIRLDVLIYLNIIFFILPIRFKLNGLSLFANLGLIFAFYFFKEQGLGPFNLASTNQEVLSYQLWELSFLLTYITIDGLSKDPQFNKLFKSILVLWGFSFITFYVAYNQEMVAEKENIRYLSSNFKDRLDEKFNMYENNLRSISGFAKSATVLNATVWDNYASQLKTQNNYPEIEAFGIIFGESNQDFLNNFVYPKDKEIFVQTLLHSKDLDEQFSRFSLSEIPVLSNKLNLPKDYKDISLSILILPIIKDFKVVSWAYYVIDNKVLFDQATHQYFNYHLDVFDGQYGNRDQRIYTNADAVNNRYEMQSSFIFANHLFSVGWSKSPYFKTNRFILSPLVAFISSLTCSLLISFLLNISRQRIEANKINEFLKLKASDSEKRYQTIFSFSSEGIVIFNKNKLIEANNKFNELFDVEGDIFELSFIDLFSTFQDDLIETIKVIPEKIRETESNGHCKFEGICKRGNNSFHAEIKLSKFMYNDNDYFIAHIIDITDRKRIEMNLIQSKEFAIEASKAKSRFLSNMSHEIRTPLNGILGLIQVMLDEKHILTPSTIENLEVMEFSTTHLLHILNEILDYSKIETGKITLEIRSNNLKKLVSNISKIHRDFAKKKNVNLNVYIDENIPESLFFDELRNGQILNNFLSNAIKFTEKGEINLRVSLIKLSDDRATVNFEVSDTGIGIPKDKIDYIFTEFTQASEDHTRRFGGTGLGLPISKKLVELQGGKIRVQSYVDIGTSMSYALLFNIDKDTLNPKEITNIKDVNFNLLKNKKILIVEDNEVNILVVKKFLDKWEMQYDIANDGDVAVKMAKDNIYELILMDFHMPKMDGVTATKFIREFNKTIPIIGLSADITHELKNDYKTYKMNDFLAKPFKSKELLVILDKYLIKVS